MTECRDHTPRWVEEAQAFECSKCMIMLPATTGICVRCKRALDDHRWMMFDFPVCP